MLSRNFRLQKVGSIEWLLKNYEFASVSRGLDELMVLDVSRGERDVDRFSQTVQQIAAQCFIPLTVGGGIVDFATAQLYMRSGADKLLLNSSFESNPALVIDLASHFGRQCIVACADFRTNASGNRAVFTKNGTRPINVSFSNWICYLQELGAGEILFQSIDRDGTGMGLDMSVVSELGTQPEVPCILMGGVGRATHIVEGLKFEFVDAVATANLFNFIGTSFLEVRKSIIDAGINVPDWNTNDFTLLRNSISNYSALGEAETKACTNLDRQN